MSSIAPEYLAGFKYYNPTTHALHPWKNLYGGFKIYRPQSFNAHQSNLLFLLA